jgi:hypothetical protein
MNWKTCLASGTVLLVMMSVAHYFKPRPVAARSIQDLHAELIAAGFTCTSDRSDGRIETGLLVSRDSLSTEEVNRLSKASTEGPGWRGKVWVTHTRPDWQLQIPSRDENVRRWGGIVAFGDEQLVRDIDALLSS